MRIGQVIRGRIETFTKYGNVKNAYLINNGHCEEFALDVIDDLGGYTNDTFEFTTEDFSDEWWVIQPRFKSDYGNLPENVKEEIDLPRHVWVYHKGKHFDAEAPDGVKNFFNLPIFKRAIERSNQ